MERIQKKIKKEEDKIEHEIENKSIKNEAEIDELCEKDLDILKREGETLETEMHEKAIEFDKPLNDNPEEKKLSRRKQKKSRY